MSEGACVRACVCVHVCVCVCHGQTGRSTKRRGNTEVRAEEGEEHRLKIRCMFSRDGNSQEYGVRVFPERRV